MQCQHKLVVLLIMVIQGVHINSDANKSVTLVKVKLSHNKPRRLRRRLESWASNLILTFATTRTVELSALTHIGTIFKTDWTILCNQIPVQ
jgi:hypothetical protein